MDRTLFSVCLALGVGTVACAPRAAHETKGDDDESFDDDPDPSEEHSSNSGGVTGDGDSGDEDGGNSGGDDEGSDSVGSEDGGTDWPPTFPVTCGRSYRETLVTLSCDPMTQDCPEGEKCVATVCERESGIYAYNRCLLAPPEGGQAGDKCVSLGDPGAGQDDCAKGFRCEFLDESEAGRCVAYCSGTWQQPDCGLVEGTLCHVSHDGVRPVCLQVCNPADPVELGCPEGLECIPADGSEGFVCDRRSGLNLPAGESCDDTSECAAGLYCRSWSEVEGCAQGSECCGP